jgi:hypothetical protein
MNSMAISGRITPSPTLTINRVLSPMRSAVMRREHYSVSQSPGAHEEAEPVMAHCTLSGR